jgi:hypothetical protein
MGRKKKKETKTEGVEQKQKNTAELSTKKTDGRVGEWPHQEATIMCAVNRNYNHGMHIPNKPCVKLFSITSAISHGFKAFGVSGSALNLYRSYLSSRIQSVKALGVTSLPVPLSFDVPQGSVLGLFLTSTPFRFLPLLLSMGLKQFSDDTQGYVHFHLDSHHQAMALGSLSACAADIEDWFTVNRVKLNFGKSWLLYTIPPRKASAIVLSPLVVGDSVLPPYDQARNLGVTFDSELTMVPHVNCIRKCALKLETQLFA